MTSRLMSFAVGLSFPGLFAMAALAAPTSTLPNPPQITVKLPNGQVAPNVTGAAAPFDGLGTNGLALVGPWHSDGTVRVFLFTGDAPEPYGTFTLTFPTAVIGPGLRPICTVTALWANPDYAYGYANPLWPQVTFQQHEYVLTGPQVTQSFVWQGGWMQPWSTYEVNISCGVKQ
jgi:hypothetical protein